MKIPPIATKREAGFYKQVKEDSPGGFEDSAIAIFGEPGTGKFEFVLTGRHVTRRCDGDSLEGAAFGGPIFYAPARRGGLAAATSTFEELARLLCPSALELVV
jgi:hypothetical protein